MCFKNLFSVGLLSVYFTLSLNSLAFASPCTELVNSLVSNLNKSVENCSPHFVEYNNSYLNMNKDEKPLLDWSYDSNGDLYYTKNTLGPGFDMDSFDLSMLEKNAKLSLLKDEEYFDIYFDSTGKYINPGIDYENEFIENFKELESLGYTYIERDKEKIKDFIEYYLVGYRILDDDIYINFEPVGNKYKIYIKDSERYNHESLRERVLNLFVGGLNGDNDYEKLFDVSFKLMNIIYDENYIGESLNKVLDSGRGVCYHNAMIGKILLENEGLEVEPIVCYYEGDKSRTHVILRTKIDGRWVYSDPTNCEVGDYSKALLTYDDLIKDYIPVHYTHIDWN